MPPLGVDERSAGTVTAIVQRSVLPGLYFVIACADDSRVVREVSERDNCEVSTLRVRVLT
jgi:hypothetical protein